MPQQCFLLGGFFLLFEWHYLIWQCIVTGGRILFQLVLSLLWLAEWLLTWSLTLVGGLVGWWRRTRLPYCWSPDPLTSTRYESTAAGELLVRTTNENGSDWIWAVVFCQWPGRW